MGRRRKQGAERTIAVIVQDKSGSMSDKTEATISGFNEYKNTLRREAAGEVLITLTQFDTRVNLIHSAVPISDVPDLNRGSYVPGGMTALYDAVGQAVRDTERIARQGDKVLVVIMTDGEENSSREWKHAGVLSALEQKRAQGWEFIFLGAGEEAWTTGASLGFNDQSSIYYTPAAHSHQGAYAAMATSTVDYTRGVPMAQSMTTNAMKASLEDEAKGDPILDPIALPGTNSTVGNVNWNVTPVKIDPTDPTDPTDDTSK